MAHDITELADWLKADTATFTTKKRMIVFTDIIHIATGEKVLEGYRYYACPIDDVLAAFDAGDLGALQSLPFALDDEGDPDTSSVCLLLAYTKSGAFLAAQPQEYQDYEPILLREPAYITSTAGASLELDQTT